MSDALEPAIRIQPAGENPRPYCYYILPDGVVGRQDRWKGKPYQLAGFTSPDNPFEVELLCQDFLADPERAIGLCAVFIDAPGGTATLDIPIAEVERTNASRNGTPRE
jgi:hypothetical protein